MLVGIGGTILAAGGAAGQAQKTVWSGAFSEAQAKRGEDVYKKECGFCHRDDAKGGGVDGGPPLVGIDWEMRWDGMTVADMITQIAELMPADDPASLPRQTYVDILGFVYRQNGATMGSTDLMADDASLQAVVATKKPAQ